LFSSFSTTQKHCWWVAITDECLWCLIRRLSLSYYTNRILFHFFINSDLSLSTVILLLILVLLLMWWRWVTNLLFACSVLTFVWCRWKLGFRKTFLNCLTICERDWWGYAIFHKRTIIKKWIVYSSSRILSFILRIRMPALFIKTRWMVSLHRVSFKVWIIS